MHNNTTHINTNTHIFSNGKKTRNNQTTMMNTTSTIGIQGPDGGVLGPGVSIVEQDGATSVGPVKKSIHTSASSSGGSVLQTISAESILRLVEVFIATSYSSSSSSSSTTKLKRGASNYS